MHIGNASSLLLVCSILWCFWKWSELTSKRANLASWGELIKITFFKKYFSFSLRSPNRNLNQWITENILNEIKISFSSFSYYLHNDRSTNLIMKIKPSYIFQHIWPNVGENPLIPKPIKLFLSSHGPLRGLKHTPIGKKISQWLLKVPKYSIRYKGILK